MNCLLCGKKYIQKSSLKKHNILCEFQQRTKREKQIDKEEIQDIPTYQELVQIVQELSLKYEKMEIQMQEFQKWTQKTKKKMNVLDWLNENVTPEQDFYSWLKEINIQEDHFNCLMEQNAIETFQQVIEHCIPLKNLNPLQSFSQKTNIIYIFTNTNTNDNQEKKEKWIEMTWDIFIKILQNIQHKLLKELSIWREKHKQEMLEKDSLSIVYNKMIIKLMDIQFSKTSKSSSSTKILHNLYIYLKKDLKTMIEYEFE